MSIGESRLEVATQEATPVAKVETLPGNPNYPNCTLYRVDEKVYVVGPDNEVTGTLSVQKDGSFSIFQRSHGEASGELQKLLSAQEQQKETKTLVALAQKIRCNSGAVFVAGPEIVEMICNIGIDTVRKCYLWKSMVLPYVVDAMARTVNSRDERDRSENVLIVKKMLSDLKLSENERNALVEQASTNYIVQRSSTQNATQLIKQWFQQGAQESGIAAER